jgi:hypothetical protein
MSYTRIVALTSLAMIAFAGNSLLCRVALKNTGIDAASFTTVRLISGAVMLCWNRAGNSGETTCQRHPSGCSQSFDKSGAG